MQVLQIDLSMTLYVFLILFDILRARKTFPSRARKKFSARAQRAIFCACAQLKIFRARANYARDIARARGARAITPLILSHITGSTYPKLCTFKEKKVVKNKKNINILQEILKIML